MGHSVAGTDLELLHVGFPLQRLSALGLVQPDFLHLRQDGHLLLCLDLLRLLALYLQVHTRF